MALIPKSRNPVDGLVSYINTIKPYHTKIVDVVVEYIFTDFINVTITDEFETCIDIGFPNLNTLFKSNIIGVDVVLRTFTINGNLAELLSPGQRIELAFSTINDGVTNPLDLVPTNEGIYNVETVVYNIISDTTTIGVKETIPVETVDGALVNSTLEYCPGSGIKGANPLPLPTILCDGGYGILYDSFSYQIAAFDTGTNTFTIIGDNIKHLSELNMVSVVDPSAFNPTIPNSEIVQRFHITSIALVGGNSVITVVEPIPVLPTGILYLFGKNHPYDTFLDCVPVGDDSSETVFVSITENFHFNIESIIDEGIHVYNMENTGVNTFGSLDTYTLNSTVIPVIPETPVMPLLPNLADLWFDTSINVLKQWRGLYWVSIPVAYWFQEDLVDINNSKYFKLTRNSIQDTGWVEIDAGFIDVLASGFDGDIVKLGFDDISNIIINSSTQPVITSSLLPPATPNELDLWFYDDPTDSDSDNIIFKLRQLFSNQWKDIQFAIWFDGTDYFLKKAIDNITDQWRPVTSEDINFLNYRISAEYSQLPNTVYHSPENVLLDLDFNGIFLLGGDYRNHIVNGKELISSNELITPVGNYNHTIYDVIRINGTLKTFTLISGTGDQTVIFRQGVGFDYINPLVRTQQYTIDSSVFDGTNTIITVNETIVDHDGVILGDVDPLGLSHIPGVFYIQPDTFIASTPLFSLPTLPSDPIIPNTAPRILQLNDYNIVEGLPITINFNTIDVEGDTIVFTTSTLPIGLTLTDNGDGTGFISGSPSIIGITNVTITSKDDGTPNLIDTMNFNIEVVDPSTLSPNSAPVLNLIGPQVFSNGTNISIPFSATDPDLDSMVFSVIGLPITLTLIDNGNGTGEINGIPVVDEVLNIIVRVSDNGNITLFDEKAFTLTISPVVQARRNKWYYSNDFDPGMNIRRRNFLHYDNKFNFFKTNAAGVACVLPNVPPVISIIPTQNGIVNSTLNIPISVTDYDGNNIVITSSVLPAGLILIDNTDGTATISGTPIIISSTNITITATDDGIGTLFTDFIFSLNVTTVSQLPPPALPVNTSPLIRTIGDWQGVLTFPISTINITTVDLEGNNIGLISSLPPAGLLFTDNLDGTGTITGTPTIAGTTNVTITATDDGVPIENSFQIFEIEILSSLVTLIPIPVPITGTSTLVIPKTALDYTATTIYYDTIGPYTIDVNLLPKDLMASTLIENMDMPGILPLIAGEAATTDVSSANITDEIVWSWGDITQWFQYMITFVDPGLNTITVAGDATTDVQVSQEFRIIANPDISGIYTVVSTIFDGIQTDIVVVEVIPNNTLGGYIEPVDNLGIQLIFSDLVGTTVEDEGAYNVIDGNTITPGSFDLPFFDVGGFDENQDTIDL